MDEAVCVAIRQGYEQSDGKGYPGHLRGERCLPARLVHSPARSRSSPGAAGLSRRCRGAQAPRDPFDPAVVDLFCSRAPELLDGLDRASDWDPVLGAEPSVTPGRALAWTRSWRRWPTWST